MVRFEADHFLGQYQHAAPPAGGVQQLQEYGNQQQMQYAGYPASPYGAQPNQQMYSQRHSTLVPSS